MENMTKENIVLAKAFKHKDTENSKFEEKFEKMQ
jgi:hypothetical protein